LDLALACWSGDHGYKTPEVMVGQWKISALGKNAKDAADDLWIARPTCY